jgi:hypothetical protein
MMSTFLGAADAAEAAMAALEVALAEDRARPHADPFEASVRELTTAAVSRGAAAAERRRRGDTAGVAAYTPNYDAVTAHKPSARFGDAQRRGCFGLVSVAAGGGRSTPLCYRSACLTSHTVGQHCSRCWGAQG